MKGLIVFSVSLLFALLLNPVFSQESEMTLSGILNNISAFENKTVTMNLKFKNYDRIFEKITFYDSENIDVTFDLADKEMVKKLSNDILNLHEGMTYSVRMKVSGKGNLGGIIAELLEFKPVISKRIP